MAPNIVDNVKDAFVSAGHKTQEGLVHLASLKNTKVSMDDDLVTLVPEGLKRAVKYPALGIAKLFRLKTSAGSTTEVATSHDFQLTNGEKLSLTCTNKTAIELQSVFNDLSKETTVKLVDNKSIEFGYNSNILGTLKLDKLDNPKQDHKNLHRIAEFKTHDLPLVKKNVAGLIQAGNLVQANEDKREAATAKFEALNTAIRNFNSDTDLVSAGISVGKNSAGKLEAKLNNRTLEGVSADDKAILEGLTIPNGPITKDTSTAGFETATTLLDDKQGKFKSRLTDLANAQLERERNKIVAADANIELRPVDGVGKVKSNAADAKAVDAFNKLFQDPTYAAVKPKVEVNEAGDKLKVTFLGMDGRTRNPEVFDVAEVRDLNSSKITALKAHMSNNAKAFAELDEALSTKDRPVPGFIGQANTTAAGVTGIVAFRDVLKADKYKDLGVDVKLSDDRNYVVVTTAIDKTPFKFLTSKFTSEGQVNARAAFLKTLDSEAIRKDAETVKSRKVNDKFGYANTTEEGVKKLTEFLTELEKPQYKPALQSINPIGDGSKFEVKFLLNDGTTTSSLTREVKNLLVAAKKPEFEEIKAGLATNSSKIREAEAARVTAAAQEKAQALTQAQNAWSTTKRSFEQATGAKVVEDPRTGKLTFTYKDKSVLPANESRTETVPTTVTKDTSPNSWDAAKTLLTDKGAFEVRVKGLVDKLKAAETATAPVGPPKAKPADAPEPKSALSPITVTGLAPEIKIGDLKEHTPLVEALAPYLNHQGGKGYFAKVNSITLRESNGNQQPITKTIRIDNAQLHSADLAVVKKYVGDLVNEINNKPTASNTPSSSTPVGPSNDIELGALGKFSLTGAPKEVSDFVTYLKKLETDKKIAFAKEGVFVKGQEAVPSFNVPATPDVPVRIEIQKLSGPDAINYVKSITAAIDKNLVK